MRLQPVTQREHPFPSGRLLVSTTDLKGRILHANAVFVATSGYALNELLGQPHNLVRHPDMPPEAFEDLWRTLKEGRPWTGYVKNRCKNGDFYCVRANVTPIRENGRTIGYMSVRTRPERHQIANAEQVYRAMRTESSHGIRIKNGQVIQPGAAMLAIEPA